MEDPFELMTINETGKNRTSVCLGIRLKVAGHETLCPVTRSCNTHEAFEQESQGLIDGIERAKKNAEALFKGSSSVAGSQIGPDMPAEEIWRVLSAVADESAWVTAFNDLDAAQRHAVAEYVLTQCNIFSGKAAVFSRRYDSETGLM